MVQMINTVERLAYVYSARKVYRKCSSKKSKIEFLNQFVEETGYNRKQAIRLLQNKKKKLSLQPGAPRKLKDSDIDLIRIIWQYANYVNAEYLHANLRRWLHDYSILQNYPLSEERIERICSVSYKTIERVLKPLRIHLETFQNAENNKEQINEICLVEQIRQVAEPGYICMDTVAHCGRTTAGSYVWTLTWTDIYTGFTINRAVWNKTFEGMRDAFEYCLAHTPFPIKSINVDNGAEFMNQHAIKYWWSKEGIKLTHSRIHMKNDNAHAEQKNRTHVRDLFARYRLDNPRYVEHMNEIYEQSCRFRNFILPCKVLKGRVLNPKSRHYIKIYDKACTPVERIINYSQTSDSVKIKLEAILESLNYYDESMKLRALLDAFFSMLWKDKSES